jgi:hypothetical protein
MVATDSDPDAENENGAKSLLEETVLFALV